MKSLFLTLLFFTTIQALSQAQKKEYLLNENGDITNLEAFKAKLSEGYVYGFIESDTAIVAKLVLREETGTLQPEQVKEIREALSGLTGNSIDKSQTLIIHFFAKPNKYSESDCIDNYVTDYTYKRFIKKNPKYARFNITAKGFVYDSKKVFEDKEGVINKYFMYGLICGNYMIILPDGRFYRMMGEYIQRDIPKKLAELEKE
ncbi:hypothetical protein KJK34_01830 [Flavobacterium sp. D11R37]|uniref:hypothetical protein n=1 Tax=Flavobacterium coralii TaxID=2838017 RepID=UPI001CA65171|nr:hypothetical protein [Flavobacterium coralii]MBY8961482.1 hypothetical protein [Flavobacterium coralii]